MRRPDYLPLCSIAGWDPTCGAGAGADLRVFSAHGTQGSAVATAITAQTSVAFERLEPLPTDWIHAQLRAVRTAAPPAAWKIGLLPDTATIDAVGDALAEATAPIVLDPVLSATAPGWALDDDGVAALRRLVPRATLITPNAAEARRLAGLPPDAPRAAAVQALLAGGTRAVLVTGGDEGDDEIADVLVRAGSEDVTWTRARLAGGPFHGTGCALSSAIAVRLAQGHDLPEAITRASQYVQALIALAAESELWLLPHLAVRPT